MALRFEPVTEDKVWGKVQHIFASPHAGVSCLIVKAGYQCSIHYHEKRGNLFTVLEGEIVVETFECTPRIPFDLANVVRFKRIKLTPGRSYSVDPLIWHRFKVIQSGRVVEVYWNALGDVDQKDIVRFDQGGPIQGAS